MALLLLLLLAPLATAQSTVDLRTNSGPIRGVRKTTLGKEIYHFHSIPFAEPPVGRLRFQAPVPVKRWVTVRNATQLSPTCWQYLGSSLERENKGTGIWLNNTVMSEDCLYLNVWSPKITTGQPPRAMMVWIYGGGFVAGSANLEIYNGAVLAASEDIVVASFQYRVGLFGFLHLPPFGVSNVGLLDQRMAMQWLRRNAPAFNVDPSRITIVGESAGSASVSMHLLSAGSHRYFSRAILHSGSFLSPWAFADPMLMQGRSRRLAVSVGCISSDWQAALRMSNVDVARCLQGISAERLNAKVSGAISGEPAARVASIKSRLGYGAKPDPNLLMYDVSFVPISAPPFFPVNGSEAMRRGTLKSVPILAGTNINEASYFVLYYLPILVNALFGSPQKLPEWPTSLADLELTPKRVTEMIGRYVLPQEWMSPALVALLGLWYDFPRPEESLTANECSQKTMVAFDRLSGDHLFKCPLYNLAKWYADSGNHPVYMYTFAHRTRSLPMPNWMGVMHGYELDYLFGMPQNSAFTRQFYNYSPGERQLASEMMRRWGNFIKTGNPNIGSKTAAPTWPPFSKSSSVLRLEASVSKALPKVTEEGAQKVKDCLFWDLAVKQLLEKSMEQQSGTSSNAWQVNSACGLALGPLLLGLLASGLALHL